MCQIHICKFKLFLVFMHYVEHGYTVCMKKRKIKGSGHIREKQLFENTISKPQAVLLITSNFIKPE